MVICRESSAAPPENSISFDSKVVSRLHCAFLLVNGVYHVEDMGSSGGTFVNGKRLSEQKTPSKPQALIEGDEIRLGTSLDEHNVQLENDANVYPLLSLDLSFAETFRLFFFLPFQVPADRRAVKFKVLMNIISKEFPNGTMILKVSGNPSSVNIKK